MMAIRPRPLCFLICLFVCLFVGLFVGLFNRPFPSSLGPLFQSESKCETILMKMTLNYMKMKLRAELIFI